MQFRVTGAGSSAGNGQARQQGRRALPSTATPQSSKHAMPDSQYRAGSSRAQHSGRSKADGGMAAYLQGRERH